MIEYKCGSCGCEMQSPSESVGGTEVCPNCKTENTVPSPPPAAQKTIAFLCPQCRNRVSVAANPTKNSTVCPSCNALVWIPGTPRPTIRGLLILPAIGLALNLILPLGSLANALSMSPTPTGQKYSVGCGGLLLLVFTIYVTFSFFEKKRSAPTLMIARATASDPAESVRRCRRESAPTPTAQADRPTAAQTPSRSGAYRPATIPAPSSSATGSNGMAADVLLIDGAMEAPFDPQDAAI